MSRASDAQRWAYCDSQDCPAEGVPAPAQQAELLGILNAHDKLIEALEAMPFTAMEWATLRGDNYSLQQAIWWQGKVDAALALARGEVE